MKAKDVAVESQLQRFFRVHGFQSLDKVRSALLLVGVACQVATVLITESGNQISVKEKYDILRKEAMEMVDGKKEGVFLIE